MKLIPGTPVAGSSDIRTVEQNAWIAAHQCVNSSHIRTEYERGILTPNGCFTFDAVNGILGLFGNVTVIGTHGQHEYMGCLPSAERFATLDDALKASLGDAASEVEPEAVVAAARAAIVSATPAEYTEPEPVAVPDPILPLAPFSPTDTHPLDGSGATIRKVSDTQISVAPAIDQPAVLHDIQPGDPIQHLPVGTAIVHTEEGVKVSVPNPASGWHLGASIAEALHKAWHWIEAEARRIVE